MKSAEQLLSQLNKLDINLSVTDGKLRCNAPKGAMTPILRDSIKQYKTDLLHLLENHQPAPAKGNIRTLPNISRQGELPLSFSQERIWLLSKLDPDNHFTGNISFAFRITGALDVPALEKTLNAIIQRHEVFRIRCETINNRPVQSVTPTTNFRLPERDLSHLPAQEKEALVAATTEQYALEPFDLSIAPILRAELLKTEEKETIFLLATHLYLFDGWSTALLFKELSSLYATFHAGQPSLLSALTAQYVDFAHWHRNWFEGEEAARQSAYWREKLKDTQLVTSLPQDQPRQCTTPSESASVEFALPGFLSEAIRKLSQHAGTTLFISLLAAFQALMYGYTRQEKLATGTIVSNRRLAETEHMIGSFANNILIASDFSAGITFRDLLDQVGKTSREAYANQDIPFEGLLGGLNTNLTTNPLFRVMFVLHQHQSQSDHNEGLTLTGLNVQKLPDIKTLSKYDLELVMIDRNGSLSGLFEYNAKLFNRTTIENLKDNFFLLLKQVTDNSELPLTDLPNFQKRAIDKTVTRNRAKKAYVAPRTPTESILTRIWQRIFGLENISVHDRFADLGGHSLMAISLIAAIKEKFDVDIELANMLVFPTISELAAYVDHSKN